MRFWRKEKRYLREMPLTFRRDWGCKCKECIRIEGNENLHNGINEDIIGPCEGNLKGWMLSIPVDR